MHHQKVTDRDGRPLEISQPHRILQVGRSPPIKLVIQGLILMVGRPDVVANQV